MDSTITQDIVLVEVEVIGIDITNPISKTITITDHQGEITMEVPEGKNRVIRITGKNQAGITQAVIKGYVDVIGGDKVPATVNWHTTPVGEVIEKLIRLDYNGIEEYNPGKLQVKVDSVVGTRDIHSIVFNTAGIADYIIENEDNPADISSFISYTTLVVTDDGDCTADGSQLHASWILSDGQSGGVEYEYAIGISPGGTDIVNWISVGTNTTVMKTGLSLTPGQTYYFSVRATNQTGLSSVGNSDGIVYQSLQIDVTPDSLTFSAVSGGVNPDAKKLSITNSGCGTLEWSITDDADWLSLTPTFGDSVSEIDEIIVSANISGLGDGTYNATITITSTMALNRQETVPVTLSVAEPFSITLISPDGGEKILGGSSYDIVWQTTGSDIHHVELLYSTNGGLTYPNTITASTAENGIYRWSPVPSLDSSTVRIKAIAEDGSNRELASDTSDSDFIIDSTAPTAPIVRDEGNESRDTTLVFSWDRVNDTSGIVGYELQVSTTPGFTEVIATKSAAGSASEVTVTWEDGVGGGNTYYARVRAQDGMMLWSEWSGTTDGIAVNPPKTSVFVVDGAVTRSGNPAQDGLVVIVNMIRGGNIIATSETTTGRYGESGRYTVTFLDFTDNSAANVGDVVEVIVKDGNGVEIGRNTHVVLEEDIEDKKAKVDVTVN